MNLTFEWDEAKASGNLRKHGVSFAEASTLFADPLSRTIPDPLHSDEEYRFVVLGRISVRAHSGGSSHPPGRKHLNHERT